MLIKNVFVIVLLISNPLINCFNKRISKSCPQKPPNAIKNIALQGSSTTINIEKVNIFLIDSLEGVQEGDNTKLDASNFENYFMDLLGDFNNTRFLSILYIDTLLSDINTVTKDNIKAIGCYYNMEDHLLFKLYEKKEGRYKELKEISCKTYLVTANAVSSIQRNIVFPKKRNHSILYINKNYTTDFSKIKGNELLYEKIESYLKTMK